MAIVMQHKNDKMRGMTLSGTDGVRLYFVDHGTGLLHPLANGAAAAEPDVHLDDAYEFAQFPNLFALRSPAALPKRTPPPPPPSVAAEASSAPEAKGEEPKDEEPAKKEWHLPEDDAALSPSGWVAVAKNLGIELTAAEKKLPRAKLGATVRAKAEALKGAAPKE